MESTVSRIVLPTTFSEAQNLTKRIWDDIRDTLQLKNQTELAKWISDSKDYLTTLSEVKDNTSLLKLYIGLTSLCHFFLDNLSELYPLFDTLLSSQNSNNMLIFSNFIAKVAQKTCETDEKFSRRYLNRGIGLIKARTDNTSNMMGLFLIREISTHLPYFFIYNYPAANQLLLPYIISTNDSIRTLALDVFTKYISILTRAHGNRQHKLTIRNTFNYAMNLLRDQRKYSTHGALGIMNAVISMRLFPSDVQASKFYTAIYPFTKNREMIIKALSYKVISLISLIDADFFLNSIWESYLTELNDLSKSPDAIPPLLDIIFSLIKFLPQPKKIINNNLISLFLTITYQATNLYYPMIVDIIAKIIQIDPDFFNINTSMLFSIINPVMFERKFIDLFPKLIKEIPPLIKQFSEGILFKIANEVTSSGQDSLSALKLIPLIPDIPFGYKEVLYEASTSYLFSKDGDLRVTASRAILYLSSSHRSLDQILKILSSTLSEPSPEIKVSFIEIFDEFYYEILAQKPVLNFLEILAKDDSPLVRISDYNLLKKLRPFSPIQVDVILRHAIRFHFMNIVCTNLVFERTKYLQSFPALLEAANQMIPMYSTLVLPLCIHIFSTRGKEVISVQTEHENQMTYHLIEVIQVILRNNKELILPHIKNIFPLFTSILGEYSDKHIKKIIIKTFSSFVEQSETPPEIYSIAPLLLENLMNIIATSNSTLLRVSAINLIGQCGAVTPQRVFGSKKFSQRVVDTDFHDIFKLQDQQSINSYFGQYIINRLHAMVDDRSLSSLREKTLTVAINVLAYMDAPNPASLEKIINIVLQYLREKIDSQKIVALSQLETLIYITKQRVTPYIPEIMNEINNIWMNPFLESIISVVTALVIVIHTDFSDFWGPIVPKLLETLASAYITKPIVTFLCLRLVALLSPISQQICQLALPQICSIISDDLVQNETKIGALESLLYISQNGNPLNFIAAIFSALFGICQSNSNKDVYNLARQVLYTLLVRIGSSSSLYIYRISDLFIDDQETKNNCLLIIQKTEETENLQITDFPFIQKSSLNQIHAKLPKVNDFDPLQIIYFFKLREAESTTRWNNWYRKALLTLISYAPCPVVSTCVELANVHQPLADYLFFPALLSTWKQLSIEFKSLLSKEFSEILHHQQIPNEILEKFITICELMEKSENPLQFETQDFLTLCTKAKLYSLAFYDAQDKYMQNPSPEAAIPIIEIAHQANRLSAVKSLIEVVPKSQTKHMLMRLGQWDLALRVFGEIIDCPNPEIEDFSSYLTAACNLHRYDLILDQKDKFDQFTKQEQKKIAFNYACASFFVKEYQQMLTYSLAMELDTLESHILLAYALILNNNMKRAEKTINSAFKLIAQQHSQKFKSLYSQVYPIIVQSQILYELTEVINFQGNPPSKVWRNRFINCEPTSEVLWDILKPRLVYAQDDTKGFMRGLTIFLHEKQFNMFNFMMKFQYPNFNTHTASPSIVLQYLRYLWALGQRHEALRMSRSLMEENPKLTKFPSLMIEYTDWMFITNGQNVQTLNDVAQILENLIKEISNQRGPADPSISLLNEKWAIANFMLFKQDKSNMNYAINAIRGFVPCITAQISVNFVDLAQLISVFFESVIDDQVLNVTSQIFSKIPPIKFVDAIPQLISQLGHENQRAADISGEIIKSLMKSSIQSLVFPLYVGTESANDNLHKNCKNLIQLALRFFPDITREAKKLRLSLINAASTLFEKWTMFAPDYLETLMDNVSNHVCPMDRLFLRLNFENIEQITNILSAGGDPSYFVELVKANSEKFICSIDNIRLCDVTEKNTEINVSHILVPGGPPSVYIEKIKDALEVLPSKQHPRRLEMIGTDGKQYIFLLKANEDLQLDLRMMQFFSLINTLVKKDFSLASDSISLRLYNILPLSTDIGLIQWIDGSDALHNLITEYRVFHGIDQVIEGHMMCQKSINDFNNLRPIQRLEIINETDVETSADDLRKVFWLKSPSADAWLERSLHFQKSMGISSIVGYILGLGDRHALNIMIDRSSGEVIHIDFGDCFEVDMRRVVFPELIPFRLTRMIIRAFGIGGVDSDFRAVCERVVNVARENSTPLKSVIEMFLNEPGEDYDNDEYTREQIISRLWDKLNGKDFDPEIALSVPQQVSALIEAARNKYNLAHLYSGWCPLW
ncbi:protein serine/threonine kinase protein [Trichomonas vaginalis G3]|uniref:protein serine/threonine kinase protein n=1 Tax=Trichomonas vaginalis (strain ATCC PRA-98 / G3) TaxID=412133 RepID=UPI0021E5C25A|nr:protein serine/threonine kinase protein [Trichomonas vaginalis G3]KAI5538696.1 protein serine/threonine kinase protein [Trichomonas vaginalis G3]